MDLILMKQTKIYLAFLLILIAAPLSACSGGAGLTSSWPGLAVDLERELVYVANGQHVFAVSLTNGTEKWRFPAEAQNPPGLYAAPALAPDGQLILGNYKKSLHSINADTGVENQGSWPFLQATNRYIASPLAVESGVYAPASDGILYALDLTGSLRWSFATEQSLWSTPLTDGENIYQPSMDRHIYALDQDTGREVWRTEDLGGAIVGKPALGEDGILYIGTFASEMLAIETSSGQVKWRATVSDWVWGGPALNGDTVYFGDLDGFFYALDSATGNIRWQIDGNGDSDTSITDPPLILDGTVYYTSKNGTLYAVDAENGAPRWNQPVGGNLYGSPLYGAESILVAPVNADALLYAVDPNGAIKWTFTPAK